MSEQQQRRIAIIGGGWAGMAAAVGLQQLGHHITLWEASRSWGGRARALPLQGPAGQRWLVDNGQHILIGAYQSCLQMMQTVGINPQQALVRVPLDLRYSDGTGLQLPGIPSPWDAALGILCAQGWSWRDKIALARTVYAWQRQRFQCPSTTTVAALCQHLPARLLQDFIEPLCVSALNLPTEQASGRIFLRVLQDSLLAGSGGSNLLLPCTDLSQLFPATAAQWLGERGAQLHLGSRVTQLSCNSASSEAVWQVQGQTFDAVVLATPSHESAKLLTSTTLPDYLQGQITPWASTAQALPHTALATVYAWTAQPPHQGKILPAPMVALRSHSENAPAQFAFDKLQLHGPEGLMAFVVSACHLPRDVLQARVIAQAKEQLGLPDLQPLQTVIEKRATFACTPHVQRPPHSIAAGLWACGDYIEGPYPATLEGAVRSGMHVAQAIHRP